MGVTVGGFLASGANAAVALADGLRGGVYPLTVWSNSKPGAGSAAEESNAGLWSQGAAHSGGPRAGETGGGWVGSPRCWRGDRGRIGDEGEDPHRGPTVRTDPRKHLVDSRQPHRPQGGGI
jgi:hypothetical protein